MSTVTLTFAGDDARLKQTFESVGSSAKQMGDDVDSASKTMVDAGAGFDRAAEGFDGVEARARGFRDVITGVQDSVTGFSSVLKGDFSGDALLTAGAGVMDLAGGFSQFLIPAMKQAVVWLGNTRIGMAVVTAAQWAWNIALNANPIGLIVIAIVALIAVFVLLWTKCDWFRNMWKSLWEGIKDIAGGVVDWFSRIPDMFKSMGEKLLNILTWPYRTAFNFISDAWNNTVGRLRWTVPSWVPVIGGNTVGAPTLPRFHHGLDRVPGAPGTEMMVRVQAGERILRADGRDGEARPAPRRAMRRVEELVNMLIAESLRAQGLKLVAQ